MWAVTKTTLSGIAAALGYVIGAGVVGLAIGVPAGGVAAAIAGILSAAGAGTYDALWWPCFVPTWGVMFVAFLIYYAAEEWRGF